MSRKLRGYPCGACGAPVLKADDDLGIESRVDAAPLSVAGEAIAVLTRREVFTLVKVAGRFLLDRRYPDDSTKRLSDPLGSPDAYGALVAHRCGKSLPRQLLAPDWFALTAPKAISAEDAMADELGLPRPYVYVEPPF